jgi:hypothetical protein
VKRAPFHPWAAHPPIVSSRAEIALPDDDIAAGDRLTVHTADCERASHGEVQVTRVGPRRVANDRLAGSDLLLEPRGGSGARMIRPQA